jgi:hypothetical protein
VQVDLTDDYVVMALFGDGAWEDNMQKLQVSHPTMKQQTIEAFARTTFAMCLHNCRCVPQGINQWRIG